MDYQKTFYLLILAVLTSFGCQQKPQTITIAGAFPNIPNAIVKLTNAENGKDTTGVNVIDGKFALKIRLLQPEIYQLSIVWPNSQQDSIVAPNGKVFHTSAFKKISQRIYIDPQHATDYKITLSPNLDGSTLEKYSLEDIYDKVGMKVKSGSTDTELYEFLDIKLKYYQNKSKSISDSLMNLRDLALKNNQNQEYEKLNDRLAGLWRLEILPEKNKEFRKEYAKNLASPVVPYFISRATDIQEYYEEYASILSKLKAEASSSEFTTIALKRLNAIKNLSLNQQLPAPEGNTLDGRKFSYQPENSRITLIDFWASWCPPCRAANPELVRIFEKYKKQGFNVVGVSLDTDKEKWKNAIIEDRLPWTNISDLKSMGSSANSSKFNVVAVPQNFLVDNKGRVMSFNLPIENIEAKLKTLLNKNN